MAKINVTYEKFSRQSENSLSELLNLKRRYVASADALYPRYRTDCNRNRDLYTAEALEAQSKQAAQVVLSHLALFMAAEGGERNGRQTDRQ